MHPRTASLLLLAFSVLFQTQSADVKPIGAAGHHIGESVKVFLRLEPDARSEIEVCYQHPNEIQCVHLLGAVEKGQRAEISTAVPADLDHPDSSDTYNFVLDGGKLVKITMSVSDVAEVMKTYGKPASDIVTPHQNDSGAKWENRECMWDTPAGFVTLDADNNPRLQDHRPLLVLESREEHARSVANAPAAKPATLQLPEASPAPQPQK
ncbi:MAG: hypothetical protein WCD49_18410 [Candidatus Acidiferrales bacterium]